MALCGVCSTPTLRDLEVLQSVRNSSSIGFKRTHSLWQTTNAKPVNFRCSSSLKSSSSNVEMEEDAQNTSPSVSSVENESAHVKQFVWNDFKILDRVSIGHGGRVLPF